MSDMTFNGKDGPSGPIPGENYTSDRQNYPWHQPPEFSNVHDALDKMSVKLTDPKTARNILAFAEGGFPLVRIAQMIIMEGISQGKWTVDMGLLLAGPFTKIFEIMCDSYDIEYDIGITEEDNWQTGDFYKAVTTLKQDGGSIKGVGEVVDQQMPQISAAADQQELGSDTGGDTPSADSVSSGDSGGGTEDLGQQGFAAMSTFTKGSK